jgi:hypothetical protein
VDKHEEANAEPIASLTPFSDTLEVKPPRSSIIELPIE